ncbi:hypothetical protein [Corynebacterium sp. UBA2622]|uniref:hypothetical protein n=1 Tax=Corynebacterium sp. UBA2622 TaxID=1946393 RepID=UPI0025C12E28|nr:hypothetical protein [Corynebacterium sp. UBA2622]
MNPTTLRLALRGATGAYNYFRKLDDEKQRDIYDAVVEAIKNDEVDDLNDLAGIDELEELYGAARAQAGDVPRASHARLDRRRAAFAAAAPDRAERRALLKAEAKDTKPRKKGRNSGAGRAIGLLAAAAATGGIAWAVYTFLLKDRLDKKDTVTYRPMAPREETDSRGNTTLVYSTATEDDREARAGSAGPLAEEPAVRDEELLSSIDSQLSTLDALDDDQRRATH